MENNNKKKLIKNINIKYHSQGNISHLNLSDIFNVLILIHLMYLNN